MDTEELRIKALTYFLSPEEGGRKTIIFTGYRPTFFWDEADSPGGNDGEIQLEGQDTCEPGTTINILVEFYVPKRPPASLKVGSKFKIREGARVIGQGHVLEIIQ